MQDDEFEQSNQSDEHGCLESVSDNDLVSIYPLSEDSSTAGNSCYRYCITYNLLLFNLAVTPAFMFFYFHFSGLI